MRLSKRRQLKVPASEGARLRTRWVSENRLNRGVAEAISEVVFAERRNRTSAEGFFGDKKNSKQRRVWSNQRRRVKCSQSAVKPLDLLSVRRSGESSDGEDCQSDLVQSQQGVLDWGSWNGAVAGADGEEKRRKPSAKKMTLAFFGAGREEEGAEAENLGFRREEEEPRYFFGVAHNSGCAWTTVNSNWILGFCEQQKSIESQFWGLLSSAGVCKIQEE
ncbi:hypothetical protein U1Q18_046835 [Sarracenia purpurea var. burkii]